MKPEQAKAVYNRIGRMQDVAQLLAVSTLKTAHAVFEFGCGTGKLAAQILELVPPTAPYLGVDISPVMVDAGACRHQ